MGGIAILTYIKKAIISIMAFMLEMKPTVLHNTISRVCTLKVRAPILNLALNARII
jgi:hypothetical protein